MRNKIVLIVGVLVLFGCYAVTVNAAIENHFLPTDGDSNYVMSNPFTDNWYFGVFDYGGDPASGLKLVQNGVPTALFTVTEDNGDFTLKVLSGIDHQQTLALGNTGEFSFYFSNGSDYDISPDILYLGSNTFQFKNSKGNVFGVDIAAVPIPGSSILLLSGLIGLATLGTRKNKNK